MKHFVLFLSVLLIASCSGWYGEEEDPPLPGERISVLELQSELEADDIALSAQGFIVADAWHNRFWPQAGGYPNHAMHHIALGEGALKEIWSVDIGSGADKRLPLTAQPILVDNIIFTLDSKSIVKAFETNNGKNLWTRNVKENKKSDPVVGGGLGFGAGHIYVTAGHSIVRALDPKTGEIKWQQDILSPARAAPTVLDNRVYVTTLDSKLVALDGQNGTILWEHQGLAEVSGLLGAASPAANATSVIAAYSSGELYSLRAENGSVAWSDNLTSVRGATSISKVLDIKAFPIIDKGVIFAVSYGGRMVAINERTGERVWVKDLTSSETPWVAGNFIFLISSDNKLIALSRDNGNFVWVTPLQRYKDEDDNVGTITWAAPLLASGRLMIFNSLGEALNIDPESGEIISKWKVGGSVTIQPIIADKTLYVLTDNGILRAYR